ncbi:MAG: methyltransferase domain-containing protein [Rickettsiales bacterium]
MTPQTNQNTTEKPQKNDDVAAPGKSALDTFLEKILKIREYASKLWSNLNNLEKSNIEAGIYHLRAGNYFDASFRFRFATMLNKNNSVAWYLLGKSSFYAKKNAKAINALRNALKLNPNLDEAKFLINACGTRENLISIPRSFIIEKSDVMATNYDQYLAQIGGNISDTFSELINGYYGDRIGINTLDLHCRGGELGTLVKNITNNMIGVEPSIKLAGMARTRRDNNLLVFNYVQSKFPEDYLKDTTDRFDLVICGLYFDNIGNLEPILSQINKVLSPRGALIFNSNKIASPDFEFVRNSLIFGHSDVYMRKVLEKTGFKIISTKEIKYASNSTDIVYLVEKI